MKTGRQPCWHRFLLSKFTRFVNRYRRTTDGNRTMLIQPYAVNRPPLTIKKKYHETFPVFLWRFPRCNSILFPRQICGGRIAAGCCIQLAVFLWEKNQAIFPAPELGGGRLLRWPGPLCQWPSKMAGRPAVGLSNQAKRNLVRCQGYKNLLIHFLLLAFCF